MSLKVFAIVVIVASLCIGGALAMHGRGHELLMKWMPAIHGGR
jgi:hypothetical protein